MAWKQRHKTDELVTNDRLLVRNCNRDEENHKYNRKILAVTWPPLQYTKQPLLIFRWGTYVPPPPPKRASWNGPLWVAALLFSETSPQLSLSFVCEPNRDGWGPLSCFHLGSIVNFVYSFFIASPTTAEPLLSRLVGIWVKSPDNQESG